MTKYSKLISFVLLCVLTLSAFGIYQTQASAPLPEIELVTEEGNADELDALYFMGNIYSTQSSGRSSTFEFKDGDFSYLNNRSVFRHLDFEYNPIANRYVSDYRSFMRGKARNTSNFTETDDEIIYTAMASDVNWRRMYDDNMLDISLLDKESEDEQSYEVRLEGASYHGVVASYYHAPELTIVTQAADEQMENNWYIYSFNFDEPEDTLSPDVNVGQALDSSSVQISFSPTGTERYIPFKSLQPGGEDEYGEITDYTTDAFHVYDTQNGDFQEIPLFEEGETLVLSEDEQVVVGQDLGETINWHDWNVADESLSELGSTDMITPSIGRLPVYYYNHSFNQGMQLVNGHVYAYEDHYSEDGYGRPMFQIIDLDSVSTDFSGYFGLEDRENDRSTEMMLFDFMINPL
jgi:hypothetical protein